MQTRTKEAFTLYELLIVVVIMGVLATAAVATNARALEKARVREAEVILNMIYQAERMYRIDNGNYAYLGDATSGLIGAGYLDRDPDNPHWDFSILGGTVNLAPPPFTFGAEALRQNTGAPFNGTNVRLDQNFTGSPQNVAPYNEDGSPKTYYGSHPLQD